MVSKQTLIDRHISRREFRQAQAKARREHAQPCDCALCLTAARAAEMIAERVAEQSLANGEVPF